MSIRPVDFNGMIQNTNSVHSEKAQQDARPEINQHNVAVIVEKENQAEARQVNHMNEKDDEYRFDDGQGNNKGYQENKKKKKKEEDNLEGDGAVVRKGERHKFDISI